MQVGRRNFRLWYRHDLSGQRGQADTKEDPPAHPAAAGFSVVLDSKRFLAMRAENVHLKDVNTNGDILLAFLPPPWEYGNFNPASTSTGKEPETE